MKRIKKMKNNTYSNDKDNIIKKQKTVEKPWVPNDPQTIPFWVATQQKYIKND